MKMLRSRYFLRVLFPVALLLLLGMASVGLYITQVFIGNAEKNQLLDLESLREAKISTVVEYLNDRIHQVQGLSYSPYVADAMRATDQVFKHEGVDSAAYQHAAGVIHGYFNHYVTYWQYYDLFLINREGDIVYSVKHEADFGTNLYHGAYADSELARVYKQAVFFLQANNSSFKPYFPSGNEAAGFLAAPIIYHGQFMGVVALQINTHEIYERMTDVTGLGETGETVAGQIDGRFVQVTIPLRHDPAAAFQRHMSLDSPIAKPIIQGSQGYTGHGIMRDWRGKSVLATWEYLPHLRWGVVSKIDQDEAMQQDYVVYRKSMLFLLLALIAAFWLAYVIARRVVIPVTRLSEVSRRFAAGDHQARVNIPSPGNELGVLINDMNTMMDKVAQADQKNQSLLLQLAHKNEILDQTVIEKTARLTAVIQHAADAIITLDTHGSIEMVNPAACHMFGYDEKNFLMLHIANIFSPQNPCDNAMALVHYIPQHKDSSSPVAALEGQRCNGECFPMEVSLSDMQNEKEKTGRPVFLLLIRDVSAAKKMREQLEHTQRLESLGVLAGGIAHDFNNLLTAIMGNAAMARMKISDLSPVAEMLEHIETASEKAAQLCRQMLAYSGKGRFVVRHIDMNELVQEMTNLLKISINKSTVLRLDLSKQALPPVHGDAAQLQQVIMNLVINASESIEGRSGTVAVRTGLTHLTEGMLKDLHSKDAINDGYYVSIEVSDTGCGMSEDTQKHLFDPFFTTKFTGRGLGMSATQGIVRGHHGAIKVYSEENKGTTFNIMLPIAEDSSVALQHEQANAALSVDAVPWQGEGVILVIDDEETIRATARLMLQTIGFTVRLANDGEAGIADYRQHQQNIIAVLLDMTMPGLNGEETFRALRLINPDVQVILSSGYNEQEAISFFAGKGLTGFIQKPYSIQSLRQKMQAYLGASASPPFDADGGT